MAYRDTDLFFKDKDTVNEKSQSQNAEICEGPMNVEVIDIAGLRRRLSDLEVTPDVRIVQERAVRIQNTGHQMSPPRNVINASDFCISSLGDIPLRATASVTNLRSAHAIPKDWLKANKSNMHLSRSQLEEYWKGFSQSFPGNRNDSVRYLRSRLLHPEENTQMMNKGTNYYTPGIIYDVPKVPIDESLQTLCDNVNDRFTCTNDNKNQQEIYHEPQDLHPWPCTCPEKCWGKLAKTYKKDNRTWLWKSREQRNKALRLQ